MLSFFERKTYSDDEGGEGYIDSEYALKYSFVITLLICLPLLGISCFLIKENAVMRHVRDAEVLDRKPPRIMSRKCGYVITHCLTQLQVALAVALFFVWIGAIVPYGFIPLWSRDKVKGSWPNYLLTICYSASFVGRLLLTWLSDKFGRLNIFIIMTFMTGALIMA